MGNLTKIKKGMDYIQTQRNFRRRDRHLELCRSSIAKFDALHLQGCP